MSTAIRVENLSKAYQIGEFSTGTISRDLARWWAKTRGKEDPFLKIGEENDRTRKGESDIVWSLKDLNFDIKQGDAVGIIGKNGAGKSTLLKILSRVTTPTTGSVKVKGRIASLLEVGTGFHPELTGRENIFLNGAILGMRKKEIRKRFDEIVDFAGIERYIDTPVKRYSSGMYVRLAFAVAAHLESEILIVDEVLAVGDAEFQKKCLGKMGEVSKGEGRTVLFVSHNMGAISSFCRTGILLGNGLIRHSGSIASTIREMEAGSERTGTDGLWHNKEEKKHDAYLRSIRLSDVNNISRTHFLSSEEIYVTLEVSFDKEISGVKVGFDLLKDGVILFRTHQTDIGAEDRFSEGTISLKCRVPANLLNHGFFLIKPQFSIHNVRSFTNIDDAVIGFQVELHKDNYYKIILDQQNFPGSLFPQLRWENVS